MQVSPELVDATMVDPFEELDVATPLLLLWPLLDWTVTVWPGPLVDPVTVPLPACTLLDIEPPALALCC
jgi:hypothetical protein